jgi:hypothetical protein
MGTFLISEASLASQSSGDEMRNVPVSLLRAQFTRMAVRIAHISTHRFRTAFAAVRRLVLQNSVKSAIPSALPRET